MSLAEDLLKLTERLYAAAAEPAQWQGALEAVVDAFGARHGTLDIYRPARIDDSVIICARVDLQTITRSRTIESMQAVASLFFAIPQGVSQRAQIMSDQDFLRSEAYNEFIRPLGGFHSLNLRGHSADQAMLLSLCRPEARKPSPLKTPPHCR